MKNLGTHPVKTPEEDVTVPSPEEWTARLVRLGLFGEEARFCARWSRLRPEMFKTVFTEALGMLKQVSAASVRRLFRLSPASPPIRMNEFDLRPEKSMPMFERAKRSGCAVLAAALLTFAPGVSDATPSILPGDSAISLSAAISRNGGEMSVLSEPSASRRVAENSIRSFAEKGHERVQQGGGSCVVYAFLDALEAAYSVTADTDDAEMLVRALMASENTGMRLSLAIESLGLRGLKVPGDILSRSLLDETPGMSTADFEKLTEHISSGGAAIVGMHGFHAFSKRCFSPSDAIFDEMNPDLSGKAMMELISASMSGGAHAVAVLGSVEADGTEYAVVKTFPEFGFEGFGLISISALEYTATEALLLPDLENTKEAFASLFDNFLETLQENASGRWSVSPAVEILRYAASEFERESGGNDEKTISKLLAVCSHVYGQVLSPEGIFSQIMETKTANGDFPEIRSTREFLLQSLSALSDSLYSKESSDSALLEAASALTRAADALEFTQSELETFSPKEALRVSEIILDGRKMEDLPKSSRRILDTILEGAEGNFRSTVGGNDSGAISDAADSFAKYLVSRTSERGTEQTSEIEVF